MKTDKRAKRAGEIEAAAYAVLEDKGYEGLSMLAVARAAKASNETLYRWYGDKLGLYRALIERNTESVRAVLDDAGAADADAMATLERAGPVLLDMLLGNRAVALNRAAAADGSGTLGRALGEAGRDTVGPWVAGVMARAVAEGALAGGSAREMAETWFAFLIGDLQLRRVTGAVAMPGEDEIAARAARSVALLRRVFAAGARCG